MHAETQRLRVNCPRLPAKQNAAADGTRMQVKPAELPAGVWPQVHRTYKETLAYRPMPRATDRPTNQLISRWARERAVNLFSIIFSVRMRGGLFAFSAVMKHTSAIFAQCAHVGNTRTAKNREYCTRDDKVRISWALSLKQISTDRSWYKIKYG